jgi:hypothetical protein
VSGAQIDRYNFETLTAVTEQVERFTRVIAITRCAEAPVIEGAACDDVQGQLIHISLAAMPDGPEKEALLAIPTGLSLKKEHVDMLVAAGDSAVRTSPALQTFLANYPPQPLQSRRVVSRTAR